MTIDSLLLKRRAVVGRRWQTQWREMGTMKNHNILLHLTKSNIFFSSFQFNSAFFALFFRFLCVCLFCLCRWIILSLQINLRSIWNLIFLCYVLLSTTTTTIYAQMSIDRRILKLKWKLMEINWVNEIKKNAFIGHFSFSEWIKLFFSSLC